MQAALMTYLMTAPNGGEPGGEAASAAQKMTGQGLRISSALRSLTDETLFTTILKEGVALHSALGLSAGDSSLMLDAESLKDADGKESSDIFSLLMQLMVLNSAAPAVGGENVAPDEHALQGVMEIISEMPETLETAASLLPQNVKAEEAPGTQPAFMNPAGNQDQPVGQTTEEAPPARRDTVLAGITDALKNELAQGGAVKETAGAGQAAAAEAAAATVSATDTADKKSSLKTGTAISHGKSAEVLNDRGVDAAANDGTETVGAAVRTRDADAFEKVMESTAADSGWGPGDNSEIGTGSPVSRKRNSSGEGAAVGSTPGGIFSDTGQKGAVSAEKTEAVERALSRFADDLMSVRGGSQEINIVLEPESLGVLTISVMKTDRGISAKIRSEDKEVAAIISDHVQKLISTMESRGITVSDVDVAYNQAEQNTGFAQQGFSQAKEDSAKGSAPPPEKTAGEDAPNTELWQTLYGGGASGDTTVDYRV